MFFWKVVEMYSAAEWEILGGDHGNSRFYLNKLPNDLQMYFRKTDYPLSHRCYKTIPSFTRTSQYPSNKYPKKCLTCYLQISSNRSESWRPVSQLLPDSWSISKMLMLIQFPGPSRLYRRRSPFVHRSQTHWKVCCVWWLHLQPIRQKKGPELLPTLENGSMIVFTKGRGSNNSACSEMRLVNTCKH